MTGRMGRLSGKVAFITGAGSGFGRAAAILFADEGAQVVVADINAETGEEAAQEARKSGGNAVAFHTDVTDPDSLQASIDRTIKEFGRLDVLYNNAGGANARDTSVIDVPLDEFWRAIKLDLFGTFLGCRFGIPHMIRQGGGSVINVVSIVALKGFVPSPSYASAKGGIAALTRSLAVAYGPEKIRVNAIAPCITKTPRVLKHLAERPEVAAMGSHHLLGFAEPLDIAQAALYLASNDSRIMTGQIIPVDSGVSAS
jgi:NAD(P)-dependent dehydrogenase (short-subunit alcohol dehydrogenase family)